MIDPPPDDAVTERIPVVRPGPPRQPSLGRAGGLMALGSLASRITGFARQVALFTVLGDTVLNDSYTVSNTLPNIVYELLIGGALSSMMIPLLTRAQVEDPDGGQAYARKLLTMAATALLGATAVGMLAAPLLTRLYLGGATTDTADPVLATTLAYMLLPQIFFYGVSAVLGAILNTRGSFGAFGWAPVLNNVVVFAVIGVYLVVPDERQLVVLGVGTTLGIAAQALVLLPVARRVGFTFRPQWGWDPRLTTAAGLGAWAVAYVLIGQAGLIVTTRVASGAAEGAVTIYTNAWLLLQVPYGILGVSLLTALMPRMSRAAAEDRLGDVTADLVLGAKLAAVLLVPISAVLTVFGTDVGIALFGLRNVDGATLLGETIAVSAFGLLPFAITMLQLRVFSALSAQRTAALVQACTVGVKIPLMLACPALLPAQDVVLGLAAANSAGFVVGAVLGQVLLRRRLGRIRSGSILLTITKTALASGVAAALAWLIAGLLAGPLDGLPAQIGSSLLLVGVVTVGAPVTVLVMRVLRVAEVNRFVVRLERLVGRGGSRRDGPGSSRL